ncbi:LBF_2804 family protein [Ferruginibacter sp. SUN106]|uniref:LBF_2804 family protein n=1 Tax=Ferruginibacter sp. SUN106 TaxID=2978348 RepID=UPI003D35B3CE
MKPIYNLFYRILPIRKVNTDNQLFLLTEEEIKIIRTKEKIAIWSAAFFGAMGVVLLYVPQYAFPHLFPNTNISMFGKTFAVPVVMLVYSVVLVIIEIMLLTFLNIWCAHEIAVATGFLNYQSKKEKDKRNLLINIGLEKKNKEILKYGIDPLQGINKKALLAWNFFFILKATLSNMLFKILIQRLLGRYAIKAVQDFAGIPIFAAWNAYGTKVILKEARVIIMGQNLIEEVCRRIRKDQAPTEEFKNLLYDTLQYIAVSKRDFHQNHFILTKNLFEIYNVQPKDRHWLEEGYYQKLHAAGKEEKEVCQLLISIGFLLDGKLSITERLQIHELKKEGLLDISTEEIKKYQHDFLNGRGIEGLITKYI